MSYRCDIDEDLWHMRRNYMIRQRERELREAMKHPRLYMWKHQSDAVEMYGSLFRALKNSLNLLTHAPRWFKVTDILKILGLGLAIPFILLYMYARGPYYVRRRFEGRLNELLEVKYPYEFDGVWGVKKLEAEVLPEED